MLLRFPATCVRLLEFAMQEPPEDRATSEAADQLALLQTHKWLREDHLNHAVQYRAGNLRTFQNGAQTLNQRAAEVHEEKARIAEQIIRDIEIALYGEPKTHF